VVVLRDMSVTVMTANPGVASFSEAGVIAESTRELVRHRNARVLSVGAQPEEVGERTVMTERPDLIRRRANLDLDQSLAVGLGMSVEMDETLAELIERETLDDDGAVGPGATSDDEMDFGGLVVKDAAH
jgi:hypothetical protein